MRNCNYSAKTHGIRPQRLWNSDIACGSAIDLHECPFVHYPYPPPFNIGYANYISTASLCTGTWLHFWHCCTILPFGQAVDSLSATTFEEGITFRHARPKRPTGSLLNRQLLGLDGGNRPSFDVWHVRPFKSDRHFVVRSPFIVNSQCSALHTKKGKTGWSRKTRDSLPQVRQFSRHELE